MAGGRRILAAIGGIKSIFIPVMRQVIEENMQISNRLPPIANFGERPLAMVNEINATVVINDKAPMS